MSPKKGLSHKKKSYGPALPRAKKSLGQNFLIDEDVLEAIVDSCAPSKDDAVLEIGPGTGLLTKKIATRAGKVIAVELDEEMKPILQSNLAHLGNVTVYFDDILKVDMNELSDEFNGSLPFKVCANLPYYISTPVIMKLLRENPRPVSCTFTVQKELGLRMAASPGSKDYGELSVAVAYYAEPKIVCLVPPEAFKPRPKVDSAVINLVPLDEPRIKVKEPAFFFDTVSACFLHRRKTLINSAAASGHPRLTKENMRDALCKMHEKYPHINENIRAEHLSPEEFAELSMLL